MFTARLSVAVVWLVLSACGDGADRVLSATCAGFDHRTDIGGTGTVSGSAVYLNRVIGSGGWTGEVVSVPIRFAQTEVVSCAAGAVLEDGLTRADGTYDIPFTNPGRVGVYVRVVSSSPDYRMSVKRSAAEPILYGLASAALDDAGTGETLSPPPLAAGGEATSGAFNILDQGVSGAKYLVDNVARSPSRELVWFWYPGSTAGTSYTPGNPAVIAVSGQAGDPDQFDDSVLLHEYGHYVLDSYSKDDSPGGEHRLNDSSLDLRLAWSEGWASFFSSVVRNDPVHIDTSGSGIRLKFDIEAPSFGSSTRFDSNELAVAAVLWDLYDPSDSDDAVQEPFLSIWSTLTDIPGDPQATTASFEDFWLAWLLKSFDPFTVLLDARSIEFWPDIYGSSVSTLEVGVRQLRTLYPSPVGRVPDVDLVEFTLSQGGTYTVETSRCVLGECLVGLSNGADTWIELTGGGLTTMINDNFDGKTYSGTCGLNCPPNDAVTLSSRVTFTGAVGPTYRVKVTRSPAAPPSAGDFGSYGILLRKN